MTKQNHFQMIFEMADNFQSSAILFFSHSERLFDDLRVSKSAFEIAKTKGWIEWKTRILLNSLVALELVDRDKDLNYQNKQYTTASLCKSSPEYIGDLINHELLQWDLWSNISEIMVSEEEHPLQQSSKFIRDNNANQVFHNAMEQLSNDLIPIVLAQKFWCTKEYIIDLAGGHGKYLVELAKRYRHIKGEIWDLEEAKEYAEKIIDANNVGDRIKFITKDISRSESFEGIICDGVMVNHVLHHFSQEQVLNLFKNISKILPQKGGHLSIIEAYLSKDELSPKSNALFSMYMMVNRPNGQLHSSLWIENALKSSGFEVVTNRLKNLEDDINLIATI